MTKKRTRAEFERIMLPHLDAAYHLARWLLRHKQDAEDAVQQSYLKAYKAFGQYSGGKSISWILKIVRNTCMSILGKTSHKAAIISIDTVKHPSFPAESFIEINDTPEANMLSRQNKQLVWQSIRSLPVEFREVIILREFEELSYQEISEITDIPIGTVMSRLSRARKQLRQKLSNLIDGSNKYEL